MLTDRLVERVLTEGCFVGGLIVNEVEYEAELEVDIVPEESQPPSEIDDMRLMRSLHRRYAPSSTATDLSFKVPPPPGTSREMGFGTLVVPGWVRERAVEVLFADDDLGEVTPLPEALLVGIMQVGVHPFCFPGGNAPGGAISAYRVDSPSCSCPLIFGYLSSRPYLSQAALSLSRHSSPAFASLSSASCSLHLLSTTQLPRTYRCIPLRPENSRPGNGDDDIWSLTNRSTGSLGS